MDHITIPAVVRTRTGVDAVTLELGRVDGWVVLAPAESGGPELTVDECTMTRLVTAWGALTSGGR